MKQPAKPKPAKTPSNRREWMLVCAAVGLTFLLRLAFILQMRGLPFSTVSPQVVDSYFYHRWALEIISGNFWGSDVFFLRPLYPYLLALFYAVFGPHILPVQLFQVVLATISCLLLYDITRRIFNARAALFAAFGFALTGILAFYTGALLYVELTMFLSLLFLWLVTKDRNGNSPRRHKDTKTGTGGDTPSGLGGLGALGGSPPASGPLPTSGRSWWHWLVAGIVFGLLVICRPELLVLLPFVFVWLWRERPSAPLTLALSPKGRGNVKVSRLTLLVAGALAVITTVPVRNYIVARDPILFTAHSGVNFYYGNNPSSDGTWQPTELERGVGFSHERMKRASRTIDGREVSWSKASAYWSRKALGFVFGQPVQYLKLLGRKFLLFLSNYEVPNDYYPETARASSLVLRLCFVNFGLVLALGLAGIFWAWPLRRKALPAYLFVGAYLLSSLVFYVLSRLRAPVIPFLLMFAGFAVSELVEALRRRRYGKVAAGLAIALVCYLVSALIPVNRKSYSAQGWTQTGNILLEQRQAVPAAAAFRRAISAEPASYSARYSLIMALAGMGKTAEAEAEYQQLARIAAGSAEAEEVRRLAAARIAIAHREFPLAAELYRASLTADPANAETHYLLGLVYVSMDSIEPARAELQRVLALDPQHEAAASALKAVESRLSR